MNDAPSMPVVSACSSVPLKTGLFGLVVEVGDEHRHRRVGGRWRSGLHEPPVDGEHRDDQDDRSRDDRMNHPALAGERPALGVEAVEVGHQVQRRLVPVLELRRDAPGDDPIERLGHRLVHGARRRQGRLEPSPEFGDRAGRVLVPPAAEQHVVEDQADRVDVRALVDRLPARLFRRHVLARSRRCRPRSSRPPSRLPRPPRETTRPSARPQRRRWTGRCRSP